MERDKIFTRKLDGQMVEIGNWEARTSDGDAFVAQPLTDSRLQMLRSGRSVGKSDRQIYRDMHPRERVFRRGMTLNDLTTPQLLIITSDLLEEEIDGLRRLSRGDLIRLVQKIASIKKVRIEIDLNLR